MYAGKTLFAQIMDFLPWTTFHRVVMRYGGNHRIRTLIVRRAIPGDGLCATDLSREPARHRSLSVGAGRQALPHGLSRTDASARPWPMPTKPATGASTPTLPSVLIRQARALYAQDRFGLELSNTVYALDSTTIDLCLSMFPWALFRSTKAAVKMHTLLDLRGTIPSFIHISDGKLHDVNVLDLLRPRRAPSTSWIEAIWTSSASMPCTRPARSL